MSVDAVGTLRKGRSVRKKIRQKRNIKMFPALNNKLPLTEPLDSEQILKIDNASMEILENVGVVFRDSIALDDWRRKGAKIRGDIVFPDRHLIRDLIKTIPSDFTICARNKDNNLEFGKNSCWGLLPMYHLQHPNIHALHRQQNKIHDLLPILVTFLKLKKIHTQLAG